MNLPLNGSILPLEIEGCSIVEWEPSLPGKFEALGDAQPSACVGDNPDAAKARDLGIRFLRPPMPFFAHRSKRTSSFSQLFR
jgi:hypothetical protein